MGVVAIYSPKGGVGKTTISVDLAWRCAVQGGHETLLWDLDVQGGSGFLLGVDNSRSAQDASLFEKHERMRRLITLTDFDNLFYLGLDSNLRNLSFKLLSLGPKKRITDLAENLRRTFERIIIDCPPVRNEVSDQIIAAADLLVVPLPVSPLAARAFDYVRQDLSARGIRKSPILPVFSMYDSRRKSHREAREGWMAQFPVVPAASQIEQSAFRRAPIGTFSKTSPAAIALERLWKGIENKLEEIKPC